MIDKDISEVTRYSHNYIFIESVIVHSISEKIK